MIVHSYVTEHDRRVAFYRVDGTQRLIYVGPKWGWPSVFWLFDSRDLLPAQWIFEEETEPNMFRFVIYQRVDFRAPCGHGWVEYREVAR